MNFYKLFNETQEAINWIDSFGDPLTLYRAIGVNSLDEINFDKLGRFWAIANPYSPYADVDKEYQAIIKIQAPRTSVDEEGTVRQYHSNYRPEQEIRLKEGAEVLIVAIKFSFDRMWKWKQFNKKARI